MDHRGPRQGWTGHQGPGYSPDGFEIRYGSYLMGTGGYGGHTGVPPRLITVRGPGGTRYYFTPRELMELAISIAVITFSFSLVLGRFDDFLSYLGPALVGVCTGFLLHELAHKMVAQKRGLWCEYRMWAEGLALAFITSIFGFLIVAPGAVVVHDLLDRGTEGRMAFAGPFTNLLVALASLPFLLFGGLIGFTAHLVIIVNTVLLLFNMLPISQMDGSKIWQWNRLYYLSLVIPGIILLILFYVRFEP